MGPLEFGYQGLPRDPETGLIYFRNRYYDPELGRFITADPKGYVDGPSMYAFEMDDPANGSDPMGTCDKGQSYDDCQAAEDARHQAVLRDQAKKQKPIGNRLVDWFQSTGVGKAVQKGTEWAHEKVDQLSSAAGDLVGSHVQEVGGPAAPPSKQAQELGKEGVLNPNACAAGVGCGQLKGAVQQQAGEIANKTAKVATEQAIYGAAGAIGGKIGELFGEAKLGEFLGQEKKYGQAGVRQLENGRVRFYGDIKPPKTEGEMIGTRRVREWDPKTGDKRTWFETLDADKKVRIVRPEAGGPKVHYMFDKDGNYTGSF